jgi:hypothetical protein
MINLMFSMLSATVAGCFVAVSLVTTTAVAGRGLVHSVRLAAHGQSGAAGLQALAALATPAVLAQIATAFARGRDRRGPRDGGKNTGRSATNAERGESRLIGDHSPMVCAGQWSDPWPGRHCSRFF